MATEEKKDRKPGRFEVGVAFYGATLKADAELSPLAADVTVRTLAAAFGREIRDVAVEVWKSAGKANPYANAPAPAAKAPETPAPPAPAFPEDIPIAATIAPTH